MAEEVEFYDLHSADGPRSWSFNPWKTRLPLNYKNIPYRTVWVELCDVHETVKALGVDPIESNMFPYSIPVVKLPQDGRYIMDSRQIARALEAEYPSPPLYVDDPLVDEVQGMIEAQVGALFAVWMPRLPKSTILGPRSKEYFITDRTKRFGKSPDEISAIYSGDRADEPWDKCRDGIMKLAGLLRKNSDGPFFMGKTFSYADIVLLSSLAILRRIGQDIFDKFVSFDNAYKELWDASQEWMKRDDK